jgi:hypothetical protein
MAFDREQRQYSAFSQACSSRRVVGPPGWLRDSGVRGGASRGRAGRTTARRNEVAARDEEEDGCDPKPDREGAHLGAPLVVPGDQRSAADGTTIRPKHVLRKAGVSAKQSDGFDSTHGSGHVGCTNRTGREPCAERSGRARPAPGVHSIPRDDLGWLWLRRASLEVLRRAVRRTGQYGGSTGWRSPCKVWRCAGSLACNRIEGVPR